MKLLIFILIFYNLHAYPNFSESELSVIEKRWGSISKNRVNDYIKNIDSFKNFSKKVQLNKTNLYLNQLLPQYDAISIQKEDDWATPKEFLIKGYGDCEDYVIIKYFTLIKLGFDKEKLFFTTVNENFTGTYHMVLSYFYEEKKSPLILDNLSFRILSLKQREDLKADIFINASGVYKLDANNTLIKIHKSAKKFNELILKIKKEHSTLKK